MNLSTQDSKSNYHTSQRKKSNLAFAFFCLDKQRIADMEVFYAYCRLMDDIADEEILTTKQKQEELLKWKLEVEKIYGETEEISDLALELRDVVKRRNIPMKYLQDIIDGVLIDTYKNNFQTFEDIRKYCYGVASAVGLASIYIFGFKDEKTKLFAETLGYALQFTNILRDVVYDYHKMDRVYIPEEELKIFNLNRQDLAQLSSKNKALFNMMYFRAKHYFNKARKLLSDEDKLNLTPALIMWEIYEYILENLKKNDFNDVRKDVFKVSKAKKICLAIRAIRKAKKKTKNTASYGKVAVLGSGISGMCSATKLCLEGFDVDLFELRAQAGGRASKINWNGKSLDNATHLLMGCYTNFFEYVNLFNTKEHYKRLNSMDFLFSKDKSVKIEFPANDASFCKRYFSIFKYSKLEGVGSLNNILLLLKLKFGFAKPKAKQTLEDYLQAHKINSQAIDIFWEPFCISALNTSLTQASASLAISTLKKSILKGGEASILYIPKKPIVDSLILSHAYIKACGGNVKLNEGVDKFIVENNAIKEIKTNKASFNEYDYIVSALNVKALIPLLDDDTKLKTKLEKIETKDIVNIYFKSDKALINNQYASLVKSPFHWIFNYSNKNDYFYSITISSSEIALKDIKQLLKDELKKFFGEFEILEILPSKFKASTISASDDSEKNRPSYSESNIKNLYLVGDWIKTNLPSTLESSAKSANSLNINK